ncbi:MAG: CC_3452 family protein [Allosphingosinicella sp.]
MVRLSLISLAILSTPALAASYFQAEPVTAPAQQRFVARDSVWLCVEGACSSSRTTSRPAIVCATLVRQVGALRSFSVDGRPFESIELTACNARAR